MRLLRLRNCSRKSSEVLGVIALPESIPASFENSIGHEVRVEFKKVEALVADRGKLRYVVREK